ncbi:hypothetical protein [Janibacter indicus]|uniref:Uncharacterized protein n=1 Tax=Janibacter indicus TaxID=857417 RepID=A0A1W1Y649_9MICO|nr:hypothetical protein [Janibacter indicus]SMC31623.1 hypothetical protein SAMN06296429_101108 [Janibacter indicus]
MGRGGVARDGRGRRGGERQPQSGDGPGEALTVEQIESALISDRDIAGRGLDCRMIITPASLGPAHWDDYLGQLQSLGHQLRLPKAATQVCLVFDTSPPSGSDRSSPSSPAA